MANWKSKISSNQQMCELADLRLLATRRANALKSSINMRKRYAADNLLSLLCSNVGIGRQGSLKNFCQEACEFESRFEHQGADWVSSLD